MESESRTGNSPYSPAFSRLLMKIAAEYINIPLDQVNSTIQHSLQEISAFVDTDRSYVFDYNMEDRTASNTFEYCKEGITPEIHNLQGIPFDIIPDWCEAHFKGEMIYIPDVDALPEGNLRDILAPQGIKSLITLPMSDGDKCLGFVGFDAVRHHRNYNQEEIRLLRLFAQMLVNLQLRSAQEKRSQELNAKLEDALSKETELNAMKTRFITMTSHQFRTPLTSIQASAELIGFGIRNLDIPNKSKLEKNINRIQQEVGRLTTLMNDVRFLGKVGSDRLPFEPRPTDLSSLLKDAIETIQDPSGHQRKVRLTITGDSRPVRVDPALMTQLIEHLVNNALKFSDGKPAPEARLTYDEQKINLSVTDQGIGVPDEEIPELFETFYRGSNAENINGTGLGLSIARQIVQLHQGRIFFKSELNEGSTVTVELTNGM